MNEEFRADISVPNGLVRGKRLADSLQRMRENGRLTDAEWWAAERFREDWSLVAASGLGAAATMPRLGQGGGNRGWLPGDAILSALRRLRVAQAKMSPRARAMATLLIIEGYPLATAAKAACLAKQNAGFALREALSLLVNCYGDYHIALRQ